MPDKEGDDEKSTKSVVSKKQKQMMGEEGYDIARDMGRVRPSKDKKDATTMPVSDEVRKTQKVNKGPSALDIVKKKYKGQIMNVGKKKANEELDLTQVAEAFGGYIVESTVEDKKNRAAKKLAKAAGINLATQGPDQAAATQAFKDMRMSKDKRFANLTPDVKTGMRATAAGEGRAEPKKPTATRADYPKTREKLLAKRAEYGIDDKGNVSDAGIEKFARRSLSRKQQASGSNVPIKLSQSDLDTAREKMVGGTEVKDSSGKVVGKTTGKYGGRLSRKAPAPGAGRKPRMNFDDFMDQLTSMSPEQKRATFAKYGDRIMNQPGLDSTAEREAQKNVSARDTVRSQAGQKERRIAGDPPETSKPPKAEPSRVSRGGIKDTLTTLERGQQKSAVGKTGGLLAKTLNPALAGVEAMRRYQRGDTKGALVSGIQALGGPIGFGAGVVNALRKSQPIADPVDTNKIQVTGDVLKQPDPTPSEFKKTRTIAKNEFGVELDKPDQPRKKSDPKSSAGSGGGKKPPKGKGPAITGDGGGDDKGGRGDALNKKKDTGGSTERNLVSKAVGDAATPVAQYQVAKDLAQGAKDILSKIKPPKVTKRTKTGRRSAGT